MRMSSSLVAPSALAVLSTVLLSGTAASQTATSSANQLPSITVQAPKQAARPVARPQRQAPPVANTVAARPTSPAPQTPPTSAQKPATGSVMARIAALEKTSSNCTDGCQTSFKYGNQPWNGCSVSQGILPYRQRAETDATTKPTRSAGRPECFWPGDNGRSGGIAAACTPRQAFRGEASGRRTQAIRKSLVHTGADIMHRKPTSDSQPSQSGGAVARR